ncbi:MAG: hypothetical protein KAU44_00565, partial [Candidatus Marinimicrobia bacterium]|nr:hypothetical protein [Candidatus Neomarinimicrobiota bacterium]
LQNSRNINEKFHQYILSVDQIKSFPVEIKLSPYINRYLFKTSDFDLIKTENTCLVFTKMYKIIIIGIIQQPDKIFLNGTQVEFSSGEFNPHGIAIPTDILAYINSKANKAAESLYSMSNNQKEVISSTYMENLEKYRNSDMIKATEADFHNSSKAAFDMLKNINEELND